MESNLKYIKDLDGFDFTKLLNVKGFGLKRVENIIHRYNEVVNYDDFSWIYRDESGNDKEYRANWINEDAEGNE